MPTVRNSENCHFNFVAARGHQCFTNTSFYFYLQLLKDQPYVVNYRHPMQCLSRHSVYFRSKATKLSQISIKQLPLKARCTDWLTDWQTDWYDHIRRRQEAAKNLYLISAQSLDIWTVSITLFTYKNHNAKYQKCVCFPLFMWFTCTYQCHNDTKIQEKKRNCMALLEM